MGPASSEYAPWRTKYQSIIESLQRNLNFFRIHVIVFVLTPLVFSGIFYASNGEFKVAYIDALFVCYSAMTVTGLTTVNLSSLTGWQQAIVFILMLVGDVVSE
jgi:Trk-type K+ transport system membrane component